MGHVHRTQGDDIGRRAFILSHQHILILLRYQAGHGLGRVIELTEHVFLSLSNRQTAVHQLTAQIGTKRLSRWQEHPSVTHRIALHKVKVAVGMQLIVIIQAVTAQEFQQRGVLHPLVGDIGEIHTCRIALVLDVKTELGLLNSR